MNQQIIRSVCRYLEVQWKVSDICQNLCSICQVAMLEMLMGNSAAIRIP